MVPQSRLWQKKIKLSIDRHDRVLHSRSGHTCILYIREHKKSAENLPRPRRYNTSPLPLTNKKARERHDWVQQSKHTRPYHGTAVRYPHTSCCRVPSAERQKKTNEKINFTLETSLVRQMSACPVRAARGHQVSLSPYAMRGVCESPLPYIPPLRFLGADI